MAVLGFAVWTERFGSDPSVVGRTINLEGSPVTVVGVMPVVGKKGRPVSYSVGKTRDGEKVKEKPEYEDLKKIWKEDPDFRP